MKNKLPVYLLLLVLYTGHAQVGIGTTNPAAALDINSGNEGVLIPRVALTGTDDMSTVATPTASELVYNTAIDGSGNTAVTPGYYYLNSDANAWIRLGTGADAWKLTGNAGVSAETYFLGTTDARDLTFRTNNIIRMRIESNGDVNIWRVNLIMNSTVPQYIIWPHITAANTSAPTCCIGRSPGSRLILGYESNPPPLPSTPYAIGIEENASWQGIPKNTATFSHKFYGGLTPLMMIRGDGKVGIGTITPAANLDVTGTTRISSLADGGIRMVTTDNNGVLSAQAVPTGDNLGDHTATQTLNMNSNNIVAANAIAIGSTTNEAPREKLQINNGNILLDNINGPSSIKWTTNSLGGPQVGIENPRGVRLRLGNAIINGSLYGIGMEADAIWYTTLRNTAQNSHKFYGGTSELMRIRGDGNVGIGTRDPWHRLTLSSNIPNYSADMRPLGGLGLTANNVANLNGQLGWVRKPNAEPVLLLQAIENTQNNPWDAVASWKDVSIGGGGNVGIGTNSPAAKLDVVGSTRISTLANGGTRMVTTDNNGELSAQAIPATDNLGNHQATATLNMNEWYIVNAGIVGTSSVQ